MALYHERSQRERKANTGTEQVRAVRVHAVDVVEPLELRNGRMILTQRGDLPLLQLLVQVYERPNVVALDIAVDDRILLGLRRLTAATETRLQGLVGKRIRSGAPMVVHLRITAILG
ncbi:MAG TPA: hypothetical protein VGE21_11825 [Flavobacteriales bacterium]